MRGLASFGPRSALFGALACAPVPPSIESLDVELDDDRVVLPSPPVDPMPDDARISLERTGYLADSLTYRVELTADGTVTWSGHAYVPIEQTGTSAIPKQEFATLWREVASAPFHQLPVTEPSIGSEFCSHFANHSPSATVIIEGAGLHRRVEDYLGCNGHESLERFRDVERRIDEVARTQQWFDRR